MLKIRYKVLLDTILGWYHPLFQSSMEPEALSNRSDEADRVVASEIDSKAPMSGLSIDSHVSSEKPLPLERNTRLIDMVFLCAIIFMLAWPWTLFGVVYHRSGIQLDAAPARFILAHPHATNFVITLLANIDCLIIDLLFSLAIIRFSQEWIAVNPSLSVFRVTVFSAFRHQNWPWHARDLKSLCTRNRWPMATLVAIFIGAFAFIPSGITSLISPVRFTQVTPLAGVELDLSSGEPDCLQWLRANRISQNCHWESVQDLSYTTCLGSTLQLLDMLESGRGRILALLSDGAERPLFSQLGGKRGVRFDGPIRGVLPIRPEAVHELDTLNPSGPLIETWQAVSQRFPYNYTLDLQSFSMDVTCNYDSKSPITILPFEAPFTLQYNGSCEPGEIDILMDAGRSPSFNSNNTLVFWACKSLSTLIQAESYSLYLRGWGDYANSIGNITCQVSPSISKLAVVYQSKSGMFSTKELPRPEEASDTTTFSYGSVEAIMLGLGSMIWQLQNWQANLLVETVVDLGKRSFNLSSSEKSPTYLRLYESMVQGILEYEATYLRLIYSARSDIPLSCLRPLNGSATYQVIGLFAQPEHAGFLMPMTLISLASLGVMARVLLMAEGTARKFDPTGDPRSLLSARQATRKGSVDNFENMVTFGHKEVVHESGKRWLDRAEVPGMVISDIV